MNTNMQSKSRKDGKELTEQDGHSNANGVIKHSNSWLRYIYSAIIGVVTYRAFFYFYIEGNQSLYEKFQFGFVDYFVMFFMAIIVFINLARRIKHFSSITILIVSSIIGLLLGIGYVFYISISGGE